jgi:uncharacterized protein YbaR (Trm112 family)
MSCGSPAPEGDRRLFVDLIDLLRCPVSHEDGWLVAAATRTVDRQILEGTLGCPVCGAEYPVREGAAWFGLGNRGDLPGAPAVDAGNPDEVIRLAALLGVDPRGGRYLFDGPWSAMVPALTVVGPLQALVLEGAMPGASMLRDCGDAVPVAAGGLRGAVLARSSAALASAAARALQANGRLVAPEATPVPGGVTVLARDERQWVAARNAVPGVSAPVSLRRA